MLSIIIPCYNASTYIINCLKSIEIAGEKYQDLYEIIIINDGSTDNTSDILNSYYSYNVHRGGKNFQHKKSRRI